MKKNNPLSLALIAFGLALILAGGLLAGCNLWTDARAGEAAQTVMAELTVSAAQEKRPASFPMAQADPLVQETVIPDHILNPNMGMPEQVIDGAAYIGWLEVPELGLQLPVITRWNYTDLKTAPCRYKGSVYQDNMIIAGHNYQEHFGKLSSLAIGDGVIFTDMDGNVFSYRVCDVEVIPEHRIQAMEQGEWDLTLFTCTLSRTSRLTIRCERVDNG